MYKYQTQILIEKNFDFSIVSPEKQKMLSEINGFDFSLIDIVQYLKKQSKNFTEQNPMLEAIDKAIVRVIEKSSKDLGTTISIRGIRRYTISIKIRKHKIITT